MFLCMGRISVLKFNGLKVPCNEPQSIRIHHGNCNKCKMLPIICNKRYITLTMLTVPTTSSECPCIACLSSHWAQLSTEFLSLIRSSDEVLHILSNILGALQRGRTSLVIPKKKPIDELMKSRNMVLLYIWHIYIKNLPTNFASILILSESIYRNPYRQIYRTIWPSVFISKVTN